MARVTCNTVDEAIDAMEKMLCPCRETVGPDDGIKWVPDKRVQIQYDGCEWRRVEDQAKEESMDDRRPKAGDVVEYEGKLRKVHCACEGAVMWSFFDDDGVYDSKCPKCGTWFGYRPYEVVHSGLSPLPRPDEPVGLDSIADVLPDLYGRKEHAAYMARTAMAEREQKMEKASSLGHALGCVMDGLCGKHRGMEGYNP